MKSIIRYLGIVASCLLLHVGCTSQLRLNQGLVNRLKGRGPVPLSSDNPYISSNLLLNREADNHQELKGFLQHRGIPAAMELEQGIFSPLFVKLFYPKQQVYYNLEETPNTWLIDGPHKIPKDKLSEVNRATRGISGKSDLALLNMSPDVEQINPISEFSPSPSPSPIKEYISSKPLPPQNDPFLERLAKAEAAQSESTAFKSVVKGNAPTSSLNEKHPAEMTPNGDLVHYVTYPGETLSMISRWYTGNRANTGRVARINNLPNPDQLVIGDVVVIPSYLIKNNNRLTENAVKALQTLAREESF